MKITPIQAYNLRNMQTSGSKPASYSSQLSFGQDDKKSTKLPGGAKAAAAMMAAAITVASPANVTASALQSPIDKTPITPYTDVERTIPAASIFYFENGVQDNIIRSVYEDGDNIVTLTDEPSSDIHKASTLREIIDKAYNYASFANSEEELESLRNKCAAEIINANPCIISQKTNASDLTKDIDFSEVLDMPLQYYDGPAEILIPNEVPFQQAPLRNQSYAEDQLTWTPSANQANVNPNNPNPKEHTYASLEDLVENEYKTHKMTEADKRLIISKILQIPANTSLYEEDLTEPMEITGTVDDARRFAKYNTAEKEGIELPVVVTAHSVENGASANISKAALDKALEDGLTWQLYPVGYNGERNNMEYDLGATNRANFTISKGDIIDLTSALQFYIDPVTGQRYTTIDNKTGAYALQTSTASSKMVSDEIAKQIVYDNLHIYAAPQDINGRHFEYGAFDVNKGYDTTDKSIEEIIQNSTLNLDRAKAIKFVDGEGKSRLPEGTKFHLVDFDYVMLVNGKPVEVTPTPTPT
ncbi:hypothetical protein IKQ26_02665, partial [bacterium]|nr:hypothetical protein [bacterium]